MFQRKVTGFFCLFVGYTEAGRTWTNKSDRRSKPQVGRAAAIGPIRIMHAVWATVFTRNTAQGSHVQE